MRRARVFAPATMGNVGPGFDVLGVALADLGDTVRICLDATGTTVTVSGRDAALVPLSPEKNAAAIAARAYLQLKKYRRGFALHIDKGLPLSGGLGGSAASSVGGALAAALALGLSYSDEDILRAAAEGESAVAGWHFDNLAPCYYGGLTVVLPGPLHRLPVIIRVPMKRAFFVALATPHLRLETKRARAVLPESSRRHDWVRQMAFTTALTLALQRGDKECVRAALHDVIVEPARAPLIPHFAAAKAAALRAGALGASISGAGPTTFALCESAAAAKHVAVAMAKAYAPIGATVHTTRLGKRGAHGKRSG